MGEHSNFKLFCGYALILLICAVIGLANGKAVSNSVDNAADGKLKALTRNKRSPYGYGEFDSMTHIYSQPEGRMGGYGRRKKKPKVVHILDCHDGHDCHNDHGHYISFDKHDDDYHDYHGDYHDDYHGDYHDYHSSHGDYHDYHGDYHNDYHGDYHDYHGDDYHGDDHGDYDYHGGYGGGGRNVYKPKIVVIKKIISQSTTTLPLPPP